MVSCAATGQLWLLGDRRGPGWPAQASRSASAWTGRAAAGERSRWLPGGRKKKKKSGRKVRANRNKRHWWKQGGVCACVANEEEVGRVEDVNKDRAEEKGGGGGGEMKSGSM